MKALCCAAAAGGQVLVDTMRGAAPTPKEGREALDAEGEDVVEGEVPAGVGQTRCFAGATCPYGYP